MESGVTLTLVGASQWNGGSSLTATAGTLTNDGSFTVNTSDGSSALFSGTLNNKGTLTVQDSGTSVGVFDGGTINNQSQGVINVSGINDGGYPLLYTTVNNYTGGTINSNSPSSVSIWVLNLTGGVVDAQTGTLNAWVDGGSVSTGGTLEAAAGATIQYNTGGNSGNTFTGTYTGSGAGHFVLNSDNLEVGTGGATFDFPSGFFQWIGGGELTATGTLTNTGFITVNTSDGSSALFSGTLTNDGTLTVENSSKSVGVFDGGTINNPSQGIIDVSGIDDGGYPLLYTTVNNAGTINANGSSSVSIWVLNLIGGVVDAQTGTLNAWVDGGSVSTGGTLEAAAGATIQYNTGGNSGNTFTGTYTGSGAGHFVLNSDNLVIGAAGATFDFPSGFFQWIGGGELTATAGTLTNTGFITVNTSDGSSALFNGTLNNKGTLTVQDSGTHVGVFDGGTINNPSQGVIDVSGIDDGGYPLLYTTVNNTGTINANGSSSVSIWVLNLTGGVVDAQTGTLNAWVDGGSVSTGGTLEAAAGATIQYNSGGNSGNTFTGTYTGSGVGHFVLNSDNLVIGAAGATFDFPSGFFQWIGGGELTATAGTLTNTGFITVNTSDGTSALFSGTLTNDGTLTVQDSGTHVGVFDGGTINNPSQGVIDVNGIDDGGYPLLYTTVNNTGTINANSPSSVSIWVLNLTGGVVDAQTGTLNAWVDGGSVSTGGTLEAAAGATIQYNTGGNSGNTFTGTYTGSGAGHFVLNSDNLEVGAAGATFDFPSGFFQWIGGGELTATAGTLTNTGFITVNTSDGSSALFNGTLNNKGTLIVQDNGTHVGVFDGGTINNQSQGVIDVSGIDDGGYPLLYTTVNNYTGGTINSNSPSSVSIWALNLTGGVVDAQTGTLNAWVDGGSVSTGGTLEAAAGATIQYNSGGNSGNTFTGTYTGSGAGHFVLNSDNLEVGTGGATFDFPSGFFQWIGGGELTATAGTLTNTGFITVNTSDGSSALFNGTLNNKGTLTVQDSGTHVGVFDGGTINNQSQGVINVSGINDGGYPLLDTTVNNAGTINATSTATVSILTLNNTGLVVVQAGTLGVNGAYTQSGTSSHTILNGSTLDPVGGTSINGGTVTGSGTIDGNVTNAAVFDPGTATAGGTIAITGNYTQTSAGTLDIGLGGTAAGQFGRLAIAGKANLNGTLNIIRLNGFVPTNTELFPVVTYGSETGTFPTVTGTSLPNNQTLTTDYAISSLTLAVTDDE